MRCSPAMVFYWAAARLKTGCSARTRGPFRAEAVLEDDAVVVLVVSTVDSLRAIACFLLHRR